MRPGKNVFRVALLSVISIVEAACHTADPKAAEERAAYLESISKAKALFEDRCAKVAGEKIYKTVENVEGILLLNVPEMGSERMLFDQNWPSAAFPRNRYSLEGGFINLFLWNETTSPGSGVRSFNVNRTDKPGYRYVDVVDEKDGKRYRYTGSMKATGKKDVNAENVRWEMARNPDYDLNVYNWTLDRVPAPEWPLPRYGIRFEDHVIPEERALWVASGTIKVIDLKTDETLGEMTRYAMSYTRPVPGASPPWLSAKTCGANGSTWVERSFVDRVLSPVKERN